MKRNIYSIFLIVIMFALSGCKSDTEDKLTVGVSILPQKTFVEAVAGDLVDVVTMIPPGYSPTNYEPTANQMIALSNADIYFSIGVTTEEINILPKLEDINSTVNVVYLADKVDDVYNPLLLEEHHHDDDQHEEENEEEHNMRDPHIWLSPKRVIVIIEEIRDELINVDPSNKEIYTNNADDYIDKLINLDKEVKDALSPFSGDSFIIYHPSFGYFADDYDLHMEVIESDGKEATAQRIKEVIDYARENNIKFILYQAEFDSQQAQTIADEINGAVIEVNPLSDDYINNLLEMTNEFTKVLR